MQGTSSTDNGWYAVRSPINTADQINVPLHITGAYQDEQTGPRGPAHLWEAATGSPKRRLLLLNGDHNSQNPGSTGPEVWGDRKAFIDHFMLGGGASPATKSVTVLWDYHRNADRELVSNGRTDAADWPLPTTTFTDWYLQPGAGLAASPPGEDATATFPYLSGSGRQSWSYQAGHEAGRPFTTSDEPPDQVAFASQELQQALAIHGPVTATLHIATTAPDTDLFVQMADEAPDGSRTYLQRGMLKASHRAIDQSRSDFRDGRMYRPWRPHTTQPGQGLVTPGEITEYLVEIFPVGHVFRAGHKIVVLVHAPPLVDSYYAYAPQRAPAGVNTIHVSRLHPSSIMLPVVPVPGSWNPAVELGCGDLEAVRCVPDS